MLANPKELSSFKETTLGKPIRGVDCKVKDCNRQGDRNTLGSFSLGNARTAKSMAKYRRFSLTE